MSDNKRKLWMRVSTEQTDEGRKKGMERMTGLNSGRHVVERLPLDGTLRAADRALNDIRQSTSRDEPRSGHVVGCVGKAATARRRVSQ